MKKLRCIIVRRPFGITCASQYQSIMDLKIAPENNSILIFKNQAADLLRRMAAKLRDARREIGPHVGISIERGIHPLQVFRVVREMDTDKSRSSVARDHTIKR